MNDLAVRISGTFRALVGRPVGFGSSGSSSVSSSLSPSRVGAISGGGSLLISYLTVCVANEMDYNWVYLLGYLHGDCQREKVSGWSSSERSGCHQFRAQSNTLLPDHAKDPDLKLTN